MVSEIIKQRSIRKTEEKPANIDHSLPLSQEQRDFAAENHNLIYKFLGYKRLSYDDYYDVVAFGYLRAVRSYTQKPELQRYSFATIANCSMRSELINHYRKEFSQKRYAIEVSLYTPVSDNESLMDVIPGSDVTADTVLYNSLMERVSALLNQKQFSIFRMKSEGYNNREIAEQYDVSTQSIQQTLAGIKKLVYANLA